MESGSFSRKGESMTARECPPSLLPDCNPNKRPGYREVCDEQDATTGNRLGVRFNLRNYGEYVVNRVQQFLMNPTKDFELLQDILPSDSTPVPRSVLLQFFVPFCRRVSSLMSAKPGTKPDLFPPGTILNESPSDMQITWITIDYFYLKLMETIASERLVKAALKFRQDTICSDGFEVNFFGRPVKSDINENLSHVMRKMVQDIDHWSAVAGMTLTTKQQVADKDKLGCPSVASPLDYVVQWGTHVESREKFTRVLQPVLFDADNPSQFYYLDVKQVMQGNYTSFMNKERDTTNQGPTMRLGWRIQDNVKCAISNWPSDDGRVDSAVAGLVKEWADGWLNENIHRFVTKANAFRPILYEWQNPGNAGAMGGGGGRLGKNADQANMNAGAMNYASSLEAPGVIGTEARGILGQGAARKDKRKVLKPPPNLGRGVISDSCFGFSPWLLSDLCNDPRSVGARFGFTARDMQYCSSVSRLQELLCSQNLVRRDNTIGRDVGRVEGTKRLREMPLDVSPPNYLHIRGEWINAVASTMEIPRMLIHDMASTSRNNQNSVVDEYRQTLSTRAQELAWIVQSAWIMQLADKTPEELMEFCEKEEPVNPHQHDWPSQVHSMMLPGMMSGMQALMMPGATGVPAPVMGALPAPERLALPTPGALPIYSIGNQHPGHSYTPQAEVHASYLSNLYSAPSFNYSPYFPFPTSMESPCFPLGSVDSTLFPQAYASYLPQAQVNASDPPNPRKRKTLDIWDLSRSGDVSLDTPGDTPTGPIVTATLTLPVATDTRPSASPIVPVSIPPAQPMVFREAEDDRFVKRFHDYAEPAFGELSGVHTSGMGGGTPAANLNPQQDGLSKTTMGIQIKLVFVELLREERLRKMKSGPNPTSMSSSSASSSASSMPPPQPQQPPPRPSHESKKLNSQFMNQPDRQAKQKKHKQQTDAQVPQMYTVQDGQLVPVLPSPPSTEPSILNTLLTRLQQLEQHMVSQQQGVPIFHHNLGGAPLGTPGVAPGMPNGMGPVVANGITYLPVPIWAPPPERGHLRQVHLQSVFDNPIRP